MDLTKYYPDIVAKYPAYVTKRELCEICHICPKTAYNLEQQGEIPYTIEQNHLIRSHKIKLTDILAYLYRRTPLSLLRPAFRKGYSADHRLFVLGNRAVDQHRDSEGFPARKAVHRPKGFYAGLSDKPILPPYPPKDPSPKGIDGYI